MSVKMSGRYLGNKRCEMTHGPSSATLITDAPKDNFGEGSSFSPTDLLAASLGACIVTTMAIYAERNGLEFKNATFELEKIMSQTPRQLGEVPIVLHLPQALSDHDRQVLERVALTCPVHRSLNSDVKISVTFLYDVE